MEKIKAEEILKKLTDDIRATIRPFKLLNGDTDENNYWRDYTVLANNGWTVVGAAGYGMGNVKAEEISEYDIEVFLDVNDRARIKANVVGGHRSGGKFPENVMNYIEHTVVQVSGKITSIKIVAELANAMGAGSQLVLEGLQK